MTVDHDESFIWQDYLEATGTKEVPHVLFSHVERSLAPGLRPGTLVEVPARGGGGYWPCALTMACGPLLRVRPLGLGSGPAAPQFWCDPAKVRVHAPGWGASRGLPPVPPPELLVAVGEEVDISSLQKAAAEEASTPADLAPSVTEDLLAGDGFIPVDRIKQGMKVEIQDKSNPYHLWVATIVENVGGRLLLRYDTPDSTSPDFWLFYSSPRLFQMGFAEEKGEPWKLQWPLEIQLQVQRSDEEWRAVLEMSKLEAHRMPLPSDLLQNRLMIPSHEFEVGMKLEAIDPSSPGSVVRPATVVKVFDNKFFLVQIDVLDGETEDEVTQLCTADYPYIFPVGWCEEHGITLSPPSGWIGNCFSWALYFLQRSEGPPAPAQLFTPRPSAAALGFECGTALEVVDPNRPDLICAASITALAGHLLCLRIESYSSEQAQYIVSSDSLDIFPVGWCESNSYPLKPPISFTQSALSKQSVQISEDSKKVDTTNGSGSSSSWCPEIYFNHKCFSGPFLSKRKLSGLPKSVGPGPVVLVMREVLSMVISVAYKSSRVLKELQCESKQPPAGHVLEVLKAKYKNNTYRANVAVVTSAENVEEFCESICHRLQVCPYMFGPVAIAENSCPEKCSNLSKTKFTHYFPHGKRKIGRPKGQASIVVPRPRKRRGRPRRPRLLQSVGLSRHVPGKPGFHRPGPGRPRTRPRTPSPAAETLNVSSMELDESQIDNTPPPQVRTSPTSQAVPILPATLPHQRRKDKVSQEPSPYHLHSNPLHWTEDDVYNYLASTNDCAGFASKFKEELIDGQAFMLLNLPTLEKQLMVQPVPALALCRHIERVKLGFLLYYCKVRNN